MSTTPDTEQRRFKRIPFDAKAEMLCAGDHWHSKLIDLSLHGALMERPPPGTESPEIPAY